MRVVKSQFEVIDLTKTNVNYFSSNVAQPEISEDSKAKRYLWKIENVAPFEYEPFNYNLEDYSPTVELSPVQFEMDGFEGDLSNWESFGNWINTLNATKGVFNEEEIRHIKNLGLEKDNTLETIKSVYAYLQNTTRYVSIQIGIGGYQPFASSFVHEKKYGDCKALSNYTHALLKLFNIKSYYTLINAGDYKADLLTKHPKPRFNHAILSVPIKNDTIFLECTSQTNPFGYSGLFTGNRKALLIKKDASRIINSKHYKPSDNQQNTNILVALDPNGVNAAVTIEKRFTGTEIEDNNFLYQYFKSKTDFKDWVSDNYNWGNIKIDSLKRIDLKEDSVLPEGGYYIRFRSPLEVVKRGNRIFISPKKYLSGSIRPRKLKVRKTPIRIRFGRHYTDSIEYQVPKAYKIENNQKQIEIKSEFGYYLRAVVKKENKIFVRRLFYLNDGRYNPEDYNALYGFLIAVNKNDAKKIILVKNDS